MTRPHNLRTVTDCPACGMDAVTHQTPTGTVIVCDWCEQTSSAA